GAAFLEMALAAAAESGQSGAASLAGVTFHQALFLDEQEATPAQLIVSPEVAGQAAFQIFSLATGRSEKVGATMHVSGSLRHLPVDDRSPRPAPLDLDEIRIRCPEDIEIGQFYRGMQDRGLKYGPRFQQVELLRRTSGEAVGQLRLPEALEPGLDRYQIHPATLDAAFHVLGAAWRDQWVGALGGSDAFLPVGVQSLHYYARPGKRVWVHATTRFSDTSNPSEIVGDLSICDAEGEVLIEIQGLRLRRLGGDGSSRPQDRLQELLYDVAWEPASSEPQPNAAPNAASSAPSSAPGSWLILADQSPLADAVAEELESRGQPCLLVDHGALRHGRQAAIDPAQPDDFRDLLKEVTATERLRGVLYLWGLDISNPEPQGVIPAVDQELGSTSLLYLLQSVAHLPGPPPAVWVVTHGAQSCGGESSPVHIGQAPLWGLGRVAAIEHAELRPALLDLDPLRPRDQQAAELIEALLHSEGENQLALRSGARHVARLTPWSAEACGRLAEGTDAANQKRITSRREPYRLQIASSGTLDGLALRRFQRQLPGSGQVEIQVAAAALNFSDVLKAMGLYPGLGDGPVPLGIECAGRISAVGEGVTDLKVGDEVVAIAPFSFASHTITSAGAVLPKPAHLDFADAAAVPIAYLTAYYALHELGRIQPGEKVLIHAAAGGVGLAAVQIAQRAGAEIFATAGSPEKRAFLKSLGVKHVYDSRSLEFAEQILAETERRGVDLVLNSLPGEAIPTSIATLAAYGRFLEIGKIDIYQNRMIGLYPFQNNLSYFAIDLDRLLRERPAVVRSMFLKLVEAFEQHQYQPLPKTTFPIDDVVGAFRYMAQRKNTGKVVVSMEAAEQSAEEAAGEPQKIRRDASYLVTGGTGALGMHVARWLADQGAGTILLVGRRKPSPATQQAIEELRRLGTDVRLVKADVADAAALETALGPVLASVPPLRGVCHAAGVLDDGILMQLDARRFATVMAPKVAGAWNLHRLTLDCPLDFFVLFSSVASLLGSPGQGNYATANAFLDGLAHYRRSQGLPALAINWGPWAGAGMAAQEAQNERRAGHGVLPLPTDEAIGILDRLLGFAGAQVTVLAVDWPQLLKAHARGVPPLLRSVGDQTNAGGAKDDALRKQLLAAPSEQRKALLEARFVEQLARVMQLDSASIDLEQPLNTLGLDSLMAIELKNGIETSLDIALPIARFMEGPSVSQLAGYALEALSQALAAPVAASAPPPAAAATNGEPLAAAGVWHGKAEELLANLDSLSHDDVDRLLAQLGESAEL
ncbi:MAG TPA: SDR family NAD(P)-dependent oxidoreductase, partial [Pirellulales bacterium]|nr:SDR family NAD(P)-dependent oxidoreductase [Pirellulales bacterium]